MVITLKLLKEIYNPPLIIFYKGAWSEKDKNSFGVVGTRKITGYGKTVTQTLTQGLVEAGFTIVSGLARGVDTIAHESALECGGRTIAVLAGGINTIFPPQNTQLAGKISDGNGLYLSEFPPSYPHLSGNFPSRNRIISGLSKAVLVTEAAEDSGSLITARLALEQNREVFAVPGPITSSLSKGPIELIKQGAKLVYDINDILEEMGIEQNANLRPVHMSAGYKNLSDTEKRILTCLENESGHIDQIVRTTQSTTAQISAALIKMEILGFVKNLGGGNYIKS
jgi:DNA processing protein